METLPTPNIYVPLERRLRSTLLFLFAIGVVVQILLSWRVIENAGGDLLQLLFWDTAADAANSILIEAQKPGQSLSKSFRKFTEEFKESRPGAGLYLIGKGGEVQDGLPEGSTHATVDIEKIRGAIAPSWPIFPFSIEDPSRPGKYTGFAATTIRGGSDPIFLLLVPPYAEIGGVPINFALQNLGTFLSIYTWVAALLIIALFFRLWIGRAILAVAGDGPLQKRAPRSLSHELNVLHEAVRDTTGQLQSSTAALSRIETQRRLLVSRVIHDLRTPFTALSGYIELAAGISGEQLAEGRARVTERYLPNCRLALQRIRLLLSGMNDYVRLESAELAFRPQFFSLHQTLQEALESLSALAAAKGISIRYAAPEEKDKATLVWGDPELIGRAVVNLLDNAVKYTPSGGTVTISLEKSESKLRCTVADTGIGIRAEDLQELGKEFFRSLESLPDDPGGTGLGLSNVREFLALHGSRLEVKSTLSSGSEFSFALRVEDTEPLSAAVPSAGRQRIFRFPLSLEAGTMTALLLLYLIALPLSTKLLLSPPALLALGGALTGLGGALLCNLAGKIMQMRFIFFLASVFAAGFTFAGLANSNEARLTNAVLIAGLSILSSFLLRTWRAAFILLLPLIAVVVLLDIQHAGGTSSLIALVANAYYFIVVLGVEGGRSRRLALRTASGFFIAFFVVAIPPAVYFHKSFETGYLRWAETRLPAITRTLQAQILSINDDSGTDNAVREGILLFPEIQADLEPLGSWAGGRRTQLLLRTGTTLGLVSPSEKMRLLGNRIIQGKIGWGIIAVGTGYVLVSGLLGYLVQILISRRLQRLAEACQTASPEKEFEKILSDERCNDEITELTGRLKKLYGSLAAERMNVEAAVVRRRELLRRIADRLEFLLGQNQSRLTALENSCSAGSEDWRPEARALWEGIQRQTKAIQTILDFSRPVVTTEPPDSINRSMLLDLVMEVASLTNAGNLSLSDRSEASFSIHAPQTQLQTLLFHALSLIRRESKGKAEFILLDSEDRTEVELRFCQPPAAEENVNDELHVLRDLADDLHREAFGESLIVLGGRLISSSEEVTSFRLKNDTPPPTP